ncbi:hypothetical protein JF50_15830 [Pseudoalteromonas luteoviolacea]|uniref:Uncharacterized protein n=2 Tax=Pseudoalteromonas luteoviolacea TaxID=43657 RepID=A0A0C1QL92_9GAMM|nr:hypothetical protein JF50_15830 [Pseudoalteromonas luteoviolacea]
MQKAMTRKQRDFRIKCLNALKKGAITTFFLFIVTAFVYQAQVNADFVIESQTYDCRLGHCEVTIVAAASVDKRVPINIRVIGVQTKWIGDAQVNKQLFTEVFSEELSGKSSQTIRLRFKIPSLDQPDYLLISLKQPPG